MTKIMIVEDENNLLDLYTSELSEEGYKVIPVNNGNDALAMLKKSKPNLVILDIKLRGAQGLEVLERIKQHNINLPVIINSAFSVFKENFSSWLADDYLVKSPDLTELKSTVKKYASVSV